MNAPSRNRRCSPYRPPLSRAPIRDNGLERNSSRGGPHCVNRQRGTRRPPAAPAVRERSFALLAVVRDSQEGTILIPRAADVDMADTPPQERQPICSQLEPVSRTRADSNNEYVLAVVI